MNAAIDPTIATANLTVRSSQAESDLIADSQILRAYTHLEERARAAKKLGELVFVIANETYQLLPYRQSIVWEMNGAKQSKLRMVSGLAKLADDSPNTVFLKQLGKELAKRLGDDGEYFSSEDFKGRLADEWAEWIPGYALAFLIKDAQGQARAIVAFCLDDAANETQQDWLVRLLGAYGHAWGALTGPRKVSASGWWRKPVFKWGVGLLALAALFVPVRLSVLSTAEIIAFDAMAIAAPMDGVIKTFHVTPNQLVKKNDLLFSLDESTLRSRRDVAFKQLAVTKADALAAAQKAFASDQSRGELANLNGRVAEREAEVAALDDMLLRVDVKAPRDGIAVFGDVNDWSGKPVVTGERIAQLADPSDRGVLIWLPVADAIALEQGAPIKLFLQVAPLKPLKATVVQTSYQVSLSPEGVASYRLRARFEGLDQDEAAIARVGLKGTAKIFGNKASLAYYLFRRPLASLRELTGW